MSKVQMLRASVKQRLTAAVEEIFIVFERTIAEYEEENQRTIAENQRTIAENQRTIAVYEEENQRQQKLLDTVFNPEVQLHRSDVQQLLESKEMVPSEQQECSSSLEQEVQTGDSDPPHIKEEEEELWTSQEGEQLQRLEEADITSFTFIPVPHEEDEEKPQSSQLHQRQTEENQAKNSDTANRMSDWCQAEVRDDGWMETSEHRSSLNSVNINEALVSDMRCNAGKKQYNCSECGKIFHHKKSLSRHMTIHSGEKSFKCPFCGKAFARKEGLRQHVRLHTGEKPFSCTVCNRRFTWQAQVKQHHCAGESSGFQTDGGSEAARNSHRGKLLPPNDGKTSDCSESGTNVIDHAEQYNCCECGKRFDSEDYLKKHMRVHSGEKPYYCLICNKRFSSRGYVAVHMRIHTGEKCFKCPFCGKAFVRKEGLRQHARLHTGEKPFSCTVCDKRFTWQTQVRQHHCAGKSARVQTDGGGCGGSEVAGNFELSDVDTQEAFSAASINSIGYNSW